MIIMFIIIISQYGGRVDTVKAFLSYHQVVLQQQTHLVATAIEIYGALGGIYQVASYNPPEAELLVSDFDVVFNGHHRVIMAGDLNCKYHNWNHHFITPNRKHLCRFTDSHLATVIGSAQPMFYLALPNATPRCSGYLNDPKDCLSSQGSLAHQSVLRSQPYLGPRQHSIR